jgi:hypothetical protein
MRKLAVVVLFLLVVGSVVCAQGLHVVLVNKVSVTVTWNRVTLDVTGQPEHVEYYNLYSIPEGKPSTKVAETAHDMVNFRPDTSLVVATALFTGGKTVLGVTAVDWAGNESAVHLSTDATAANGGWYLLIDSIAPIKPMGMRVN